MRILITGGAGYIGSHTAQFLIRNGHEITIFDNLSTGDLDAIPKKVNFVEGDICDYSALPSLMIKNKIEAVIHLAAKINLKESYLLPLDYYETNVVGTFNVLKAMAESKIRHIIFSSSAAVFKENIHLKSLNEDDVLEPKSPYAQSKYICEMILKDFAKAGLIEFLSFRYFNVSGASDDGKNGQRTKDAHHLIHLACKAATGKKDSIEVYGTDYPTHDGTCVRDYIHVMDLAEIHDLGLKYLSEGGKSEVLNCGYGVGYSVEQILEKIQNISGVRLNVQRTSRRVGDCPFLVADPTHLKRILNWKPKRDNLDLICQSSLEWEKKYPN